MPEYDDNDDLNEPHPAEKRIEAKAQRKLAVFEAGLTDLNDEQRTALLAVAKDDLSKDTLLEKAKSLGFYKEPEAEPAEPTVDETVATEERIAAAAVGSAPPAPPTAPLESVRDRVQNLPSSQVYVGSPLYQEALAAIKQSGLTMGQVEHDGQFVPLTS